MGLLESFRGMRQPDGISRREFLKLSAIAAALAVTGCGGTGTSTPIPLPATVVPLNPDQIRNLSARDRLFRELDILPPSPIRTHLQDRVKPLFRDPPPAEVVHGEYRYPIHESSLVLEDNTEPFAIGLFSMRSPEANIPAELHVSKEIIVNLPVTDLLTVQEKNGFPSKFKRGRDVFIPLPFVPEDPIYTGIAPEIIIRRKPLSQNPVDQEYQDTFERFVWVKEASSALLSEILFEETYKTMRRLRLQTDFTVFTEQGNQGSVNMVIDALGAIISKESRLLSLIDMGGYVVSYKALENDPEFQRMMNMPEANQEFKRLYEEIIKPADLGNTPDEIMRNTFSLILQKPELLNFPHVGNFEEIPLLIVPGNRQQAFSLPRTGMPFNLYNNLPLAA